jgi:hypothetical protein
MTQDEIIEMARQVGAKTPRLIWPPTFTKSIDFTPEALEIFAKLVAAKEREACAKVSHPPQRTEQEPVALPCCGYTDASAVKWNPLNGVVQCHNCGQTYTHPPQRTWVGLTTEETLDMFDLNNVYGSKWIEFARTVEAKLKEKNT